MFYALEHNENNNEHSELRLSKERNIIVLVGCPGAQDLTENCHDS